MGRFELLVGSSEFWTRARQDIARAQGRVLVQAMTFEGDAAGTKVAQAIDASGARDRRVLVDDYTRHVLNDTFLLFSHDRALAAEARATWDMFDELQRNGVQVRVTNPIGRNPLRYVARNHKKLLVMDDVAWLGGINFSDHNFSWHDMMLRIDDAEVADWLSRQFDQDWYGKPAFARRGFGPELEIESFDGATNVANAGKLLSHFAEATRSIEVLSAYPTMPFTHAMAHAARRGVEVTIHTPRPNNKPIVRDYLLGFAAKAGIRLRLVDLMTHVKAALIDGETLLAGSSNFDFVSYRRNSEYVAVLRDPALIAEVEARLLAPARSEGTAPLAEDLRGWAPIRAAATLKAADLALRHVPVGPRIEEWVRPRRDEQREEQSAMGAEMVGDSGGNP